MAISLLLALASEAKSVHTHLEAKPVRCGQTMGKVTPYHKDKVRRGWLMGLEPTTTGTTIQGSAIELQPPYACA